MLPDTVSVNDPPVPNCRVHDTTPPIFNMAQAAFAVIVTVRLVDPCLIYTMSPATGTDAPDAPPSDADQVDVAFQLPFATA